MIDGQPLFPGESETDQFQVINSMLGQFPACLRNAIERRRDMRNIKLKDKPR